MIQEKVNLMVKILKGTNHPGEGDLVIMLRIYERMDKVWFDVKRKNGKHHIIIEPHLFKLFQILKN